MKKQKFHLYIIFTYSRRGNWNSNNILIIYMFFMMHLLILS